MSSHSSNETTLERRPALEPLRLLVKVVVISVLRGEIAKIVALLPDPHLVLLLPLRPTRLGHSQTSACAKAERLPFDGAQRSSLLTEASLIGVFFAPGAVHRLLLPPLPRPLDTIRRHRLATPAPLPRREPIRSELPLLD